MSNWKEAMRLLCLAGDDGMMGTRYESVPDADEFFDTMKMYMGNAPSDWTGLCTSEYTYHETEGYAFLAWGNLYIAIPESDIYERYTGKAVRMETLISVVQNCQNACWRQEEDSAQLRSDIDNYLQGL